MICNNCGNEISDDSKFCYKCGNKTTKKHNNKLKHTQKICNRCGSKISSDAVFCSTCGNNIGSINSDEIDGYNTENDNAQIDNVPQEFSDNTNQSTEREEFNSPNVKEQSKTNKNKNEKGSNAKLIWICAIAVFMIVLGIASSTGKDIQLTETYTNKEEGISFRYPDDWESENLPEGDSTILSLDAETGRNYNVSMDIELEKTPYEGFGTTDLFSNLSNAEWANGWMVKEIFNTKIDDIDAIKITFTSIYARTGIQYSYVQNGNIYTVTFIAPTYYSNKYNSIFNAIMETYTISNPINSTTQEQNSKDEQQSDGNGLSEEEALDVAQQFIDTHPLFDRTLTGYVQYVPQIDEVSTTGLYLVKAKAPDGSIRSIWVDKTTGSVFLNNHESGTLEDAEKVYQEEFVSNEDGDEILLNGTKVTDYLDGSLDKIHKDFGNPIAGTPIDGTHIKSDNYIDYGSVKVLYDNTLFIKAIWGEPENFTYKGVTLNKNRDEIVNLFGTPSNEYTKNNNEGASSVHWVVYYKDNNEISFTFDEKSGNADFVSFTKNYEE